MKLRICFSASALLLFTWSAHGQCIDELNAYERAEENAINSATAREELNPRAFKPAELRRNYEISVRQFVMSTDTSFFTIPVLEEGINNNRQRLAELERIQRNPQRGKQSARLCHQERPNWASCVSAAFAVNVAKERINLCMYEQRLAAMRGTPAANATQSQQSPQSNQTPERAKTPEQQMTQQAAAQAREMQAKGDADAKKQGRRRHDPAMEANDCISIDTSKPGFGLFRNSCNFKVEVAWCNENPKKDSWADVHNCVGKGGQMTGVRANGESASHIKNTERVHWLACKEPALPLEVTFDGTQLQGRCRVLFAN